MKDIMYQFLKVNDVKIYDVTLLKKSMGFFQNVVQKDINTNFKN